MPLLAKESESSFKPVSAGTKVARCFGVIDLGTQVPNNPKYRPTRKVILQWETPDETYEFEGKVIPMSILKEYSLTLGKGQKESNLGRDLTSWRGKPFTDEEKAGFDIQRLLNVPCYLSIAHYKKLDGTTGAKVSTIMGVPKTATVPELSRETIFYSIDMGKGKEYQKLPEWMQAKIAACLEWCPTDTHATASTATEEEPPVDDSDIPF